MRMVSKIRLISPHLSFNSTCVPLSIPLRRLGITSKGGRLGLPPFALAEALLKARLRIRLSRLVLALGDDLAGFGRDRRLLGPDQRQVVGPSSPPPVVMARMIRGRLQA